MYRLAWKTIDWTRQNIMFYSSPDDITFDWIGFQNNVWIYIFLFYVIFTTVIISIMYFDY